MRRALVISVALLLSLAGCGSAGHGAKSQSTAGHATSSPQATSATAPTNSVPAPGDQVKQAFIDTIRSRLAASGLPPEYSRCVVGKAQAETTTQVDKLAALPADQQSATARALGRRYGRQCLAAGAGISTFRNSFLRSLTAALSGSKLSGAYQRCVLAKARQVDRARLSRLFSAIASGGAGRAKSEALGRELGASCISGGIRP